MSAYCRILAVTGKENKIEQKFKRTMVLYGRCASDPAAVPDLPWWNGGKPDLELPRV